MALFFDPNKHIDQDPCEDDEEAQKVAVNTAIKMDGRFIELLNYKLIKDEPTYLSLNRRKMLLTIFSRNQKRTKAA